MKLNLFYLIVAAILTLTIAFQFIPITPHSRRTKSLFIMADVQVTFPNNKSVKVSAGSALKDAAKKAGFSPNFGCEEGNLILCSFL
jgi:hypothetical protein